MNSLQSILDAGSKIWLDSVDPGHVQAHRAAGVTGATSNPVIVSDIIKTGSMDQQIAELAEQGKDKADIAWALTNTLVNDAQQVFEPVWRETRGDDGYVSFELDPLIDAADSTLSHEDRVKRYIELGLKWSKGHRNRMIKVPATPAGIEALTDLAAAGVTLNVTLIFTMRQYEAAREAIWAGATKRPNLDEFKSVYSIFISRVDVYTHKHLDALCDDAQGMVGLANAKRLWQSNQKWWADKPVKLQQEIVFASTGAKLEGDPPDKYIRELVGSDIMTNPPETNEMIAESGNPYSRTIDQMPPDSVLEEIDQKVDMAELERTLMEEGLAKFADPHRALIDLIGEKRPAVTG